MERRDFLFKSVLGGLTAYLLQACGSATTTPTVRTGGNCAANGTNAYIDQNHGHTITVTSAEIAAGTDKTYNIQGTGDHNHQVTITAAMFASLASNTGVQPASTVTNSHAHLLTINCA